MRFRARTVSIALCTGLLAGLASAQSISSVTSDNDEVVDMFCSASVGSTLTIEGTGFGTAKPKVFLTDGEGKKYVLKVTGNDDTQITALIKKAAAGDLTLNVLPKGADEPATATVTIEVPTIANLLNAAMDDTITSSDPNLEFVISGHFFGTKKGKVFIGTKKAKVLEWADDMIHLVMPKTLPDGFWDITLDNKLGVDDDESIQMTNSPLKLGKAIVHLNVGADHVTLHLGGGLGDFELPDTTGYAAVVAATTGGTHPKVLVLAVGFADGGELPYTASFPNVIGEYISVGKVNLQNPLDGGIKIYFPDDGFAVTINSNSGGQVAGTFNGTMHSLIPGVDDVVIDGDFVIDLTEIAP